MAHDAQDSAPAAFHVEDEDVDLSDLRWDDSVVLVVFWLLAFVVFLQFFTRYVLNNSIGWTEEVARYLLIAVTFIGAILVVRKESQIAVEVLYRWLPRRARRALQNLVDVLSVAFYAYMCWTCAKLASRTGGMMASFDVPKAWVYWIVVVCFAAMTLHAILGFIRHLRTGTSRLIDPDAPAHAAPSLE